LRSFSLVGGPVTKTYTQLQKQIAKLQTEAEAVKAKVAKAAKKAPSTPKYTDGLGNTWTGIGKRPRWFLAAIEGGKTPKDLEIAAPLA
jgi:DNA-binding protein H-NS